MEFVYCDGGRSNYFKASNVGDCVTRAICNATGKDYKEVYDRLKELAKLETARQIKKHRGNKRSSVRDGVFKETWKKYLNEIGWKHVATTGIGQVQKVHLSEDELPNGTLIVQVSRHLTCVKDKVLYDTYDCTRDGSRMVYGYWIAPTEQELADLEQYKKEVAEAENKHKSFQEKKKLIRYEYYKKISKLKRDIARLERERDIAISNVRG